MILKDLLEKIEPVGCDIVIWGRYDEDNYLFKGDISDVPWIYVDCEIRREDDEDQPIRFITEKNEYGVYKVIIIVFIIEE